MFSRVIICNFFFYVLLISSYTVKPTASDSNSVQGDAETKEMSQGDGNQLPIPKEGGQQPLQPKPRTWVTNMQQQPFYPDTQEIPKYPFLSQFNLNYPNRQRPLLYKYQNYMYQNYPTQTYLPYSYGYDQRRQQGTWNAPIEPLLGKNYWEYPTAKPKQQIVDSPEKAISGWVPQTYNQQQRQYWVAPVRAPKMDQSWYSMPRQTFYYGRRPISRQPIPPTPKPKAFDPTSEQHFLAEYSTGSIQESDSGLQLISDEAEKGKEGSINEFQNPFGWQNYPITRPAWPLPRPVVPQLPKPSNINAWIPRPDYVPSNNRPQPELPSTNTESPDKAIEVKRTCYMNCRRRCGLGYGNSNACSWYSGCGRRNWGCGGARPNYRPNVNGRNWRYRNNGQYWGAAAQWNNGPTNEQDQTSEDLNDPGTEAAEEKPCGPELPNSGQWTWIENNWKWVCNGKAPTEDSEQETVIDA